MLIATTLISADYILFLRVRALFSQGRIITGFLISLFGLEALSLLGMAIHESIAVEPFVLEFDGISVCAGYGVSTAENLVTWYIPLAYGTLLTVLALYKARQFWKESAGFKGLNLVKILIRDQAFYFLAVIVFCVANILPEQVNSNSVFGDIFAAIGNPGVLSLVGSRLLLNMKEAGEKGLNQGISHSLQSISSNIDFAAPSDGLAETSLGNTAESMEAGIQETV